MTVTPAVPLLNSLVAVIVTAPAASPVTNPVPLTVASPVLLVPQVTDRPLKGAPVESSGVAISCTVPLTWMPDATGLTATMATGTGFTVTTALSALPPGPWAITLYFPGWEPDL